MYFGTGNTVPAELKSGAAAARRLRHQANRSVLVRELPIDQCRRMTANSERACPRASSLPVSRDEDLEHAGRPIRQDDGNGASVVSRTPYIGSR
jgi:hypothetical protein